MPEDTKALRPLISYDAQEERLQRVEHTQAEHAVKLAETAASVAHLAQRIDAGFENLCEKIDNVVSPVAARAAETADRLTALGDVVGDQRRAVESLQDAAARRTARWDALKKYVAPVLTGAAAIMLKELVVWLSHH